MKRLFIIPLLYTCISMPMNIEEWLEQMADEHVQTHYIEEEAPAAQPLITLVSKRQLEEAGYKPSDDLNEEAIHNIDTLNRGLVETLDLDQRVAELLHDDRQKFTAGTKKKGVFRKKEKITEISGIGEKEVPDDLYGANKQEEEEEQELEQALRSPRLFGRRSPRSSDGRKSPRSGKKKSPRDDDEAPSKDYGSFGKRSPRTKKKAETAFVLKPLEKKVSQQKQESLAKYRNDLDEIAEKHLSTNPGTELPEDTFKGILKETIRCHLETQRTLLTYLTAMQEWALGKYEPIISEEESDLLATTILEVEQNPKKFLEKQTFDQWCRGLGIRSIEKNKERRERRGKPSHVTNEALSGMLGHTNIYVSRKPQTIKKETPKSSRKKNDKTVTTSPDKQQIKRAHTFSAVQLRKTPLQDKRQLLLGRSRHSNETTPKTMLASPIRSTRKQIPQQLLTMSPVTNSSDEESGEEVQYSEDPTYEQTVMLDSDSDEAPPPQKIYFCEKCACKLSEYAQYCPACDPALYDDQSGFACIDCSAPLDEDVEYCRDCAYLRLSKKQFRCIACKTTLEENVPYCRDCAYEMQKSPRGARSTSALPQLPPARSPRTLNGSIDSVEPQTSPRVARSTNAMPHVPPKSPGRLNSTTASPELERAPQPIGRGRGRGRGTIQKSPRNSPKLPPKKPLPRVPKSEDSLEY